MSRYTVKFLHLSTGYIAGTIPPKFSDDHRKPIHACGSDATYHCDGRYGLPRIRQEARRYCIDHKYIGYEVVRYNDGYGPDRTITGAVLVVE